MYSFMLSFFSSSSAVFELNSFIDNSKIDLALKFFIFPEADMTFLFSTTTFFSVQEDLASYK